MGKRNLRFLCLILGLAMVIAGCGRSYGETAVQPSTAPTEPAPPANPYQAQDFYLAQDGYMACTRTPTALGVDVSEHQGAIDWQEVARAGIQFAMVRVGYRGFDLGGIYEDDFARENLRGALDAGLQVGVYFYSQAITAEEAREEAEMVLDLIAGYDITYPVVFDWEWVSADARTGGLTSRELTDLTREFCQTVADAGYEAMFYFNQSLAQTMFRLRELQDYGFWLAQYSEAMTFAYAVDMWQYTCTGSVPGIATNVDINLRFLDKTA